MAQSYDRRINMYINIDGKDVVNSVKSIRAEMNKLIGQQSNMTRGSDEYVKATQSIQQLKGILKSHAEDIGRIQTPMQKAIETAKGLLPAFGFAALASGAKSAFDKIVSATHAGADAWEFAMAGMNNGLDHFWKSLATGDFTNFSSRMKEAIETGYKYASMLDEVDDKTRALSMVESDARGEELKLEEKLKNKGLGKAAQIQAGKDRIALEQKLSLDRQNIANERFDAEVLMAQQQTQLSRDQLIQVSKDIDSKKKLEAQAYNDKVTQYNNLRALNTTQAGGTAYGGATTIQKDDTPEIKALKTSIDTTEGSVKEYARFMKQYDVLTLDQQQKFVSAYVQRNEAINSAPENLKKVITKVNNLLAGVEDNGQKIEDKALKDKEKAHDDAYKALDASNRKELNLVKQHQIDVKDTEENYNKALEEEEINALNKKLALQLKFGDDTTETMAAILDKQLKIQADIDKKTDEEKKKAHKKELDDLENKGKNELAQVKKDAIDKGLTEEETNALLIDKEIEYLNKKLELQQKYGEDSAETATAIAAKIAELAGNALKGDEDRIKSLDDLKKKYEDREVNAKKERDDALTALDKAQKDGLIKSEEEYQRIKKNINEEYNQARLEKAIEFGQKTQQIISLGSNLVQTLMDAELAKAGDNEEKKAQIRKKYANAQFLMAASEIVVSTAVAIMQGFAQLGPIGGAIAAVLLTATGLAQLAIANTEREKMKGYASGGYTDGDHIYRAGEEGPEFIAPNWMLKNKYSGPLIDKLESWRQNPVSISQGAFETTKHFSNSTFTDQNFAPKASNSEIVVQTTSDPDLKNILAKNTEAIKELMNWKPAISIETYERKRKEYDKFNNGGFKR